MSTDPSRPDETPPADYRVTPAAPPHADPCRTPDAAAPARRRDTQPAGTPPASVGDFETQAAGAPTPPAAETLPPSVPGYSIEGVLGRGGMGVVYKARHLALKRTVALKMILAGGHASELQVARFRAEAEAVARLQHPGIVQVFEVGEAAGLPWCALEFCPGGSLSGKLGGDPVAPADAAQLAAQLAHAMHACHRAGILHRDLKPANVLLAEDGTAKITDFGLAKQLEAASGQTQTGAVLGTPSYMPPEQARGDAEIGPAADVYSLGAMLYEFLVGRPPFKGATLRQTVAQVLADDPVPPRQFDPRIPRDIETICLKALRKDPAQRYASAAALADDLERFLDGRPITARPVSAAEKAVKWVRRRPAAAGMLAAGVMAIALGAGLYVRESQAAIADANRKTIEAQEQTRLRDEAAATAAQARAEADAARRQTREAEERRDPAAIDAARQRWGLAASRFEAAAALLARVTGPVGEELRQQNERELAESRQGAGDTEKYLAFRADAAEEAWHGNPAGGVTAGQSRARAAEAGQRALARYGLGNVPEDAGPEPAGLFDGLTAAPVPRTQIAGECLNVLLIWAQAVSPVETTEGGRRAAEPATAARADRILLRAAALAQWSGLDSGELHSRRAAYRSALGDADGSGRELALAAKVNPDNLLDHLQAASAEYLAARPEAPADERRARLEAALKACAAALLKWPGQPDALYLQGLCYLRLGKYAQARTALEACKAQRPQGAVWVEGLLGLAYRETGEVEQADGAFSAALTADDPDLVYASLVNRAVLRFRQRRFDDSREDLKRAAAMKPDVYLAYVDLALTEQAAGDAPAAIAALDKAVELQPADPRFRYQRAAVHLAAGHAEEALADFRAGIERDRGDDPKQLAEARLRVGRLLHKARQHGEAVKEYRKALELQPKLADAERLLAESLLQLDNYKEADAALKRYARLVPDAPAAVHRARAAIRLYRNDLDGAIEAYTLALARTEAAPDERDDADEPTPALVLRSALRAGRGWVYLLLEAERPALADFEEAVRLDPKNADALCGRADARVRLGQVARATADADAAVRLKPADPRTLYNAARVYAEAVGQVESAKGSTRSTMEQTYLYQERAVALLRQATERQSPSERLAFWKERVLKDPAFSPIRRSTALARLAAEMGDTP